MKGKTNVYNSKVSGEKLHLTLTTNQPTHTDIIGAIITVSYEDTTETYVWNNSQLIIDIPYNVSYTVSFSNVDGYKSPDSFSYTSKPDNNRFIEAIYQTEIVTINVSASEGEVSGYEITIYNTKTLDVIAVQNIPSGSYKIPYNIEYKIQCNNINNYITPETIVFVANQSIRDINIIYEKQPLGIFIQGISQKLYTTDEWNNQEIPNGIAVLTDQCKFVMALEHIPHLDLVGDRYTYPDLPISYGPSNDYNGYYNTDKIIEAYGSSKYLAAGACKNYLFGNMAKGYLGAAGEWQVARQNKEDLNSALTLIGGTTMKEGGYGTSTEYSSSLVWEQWFDSDSYLDYYSKNRHYYVRAFSPYIANPKIISFKISSTTYQCWEGTTWRQWCGSAFNIDRYYVATVQSKEYIDTPNGKYGVEYEDITAVRPDDVIISGYTYVYG